MAGRFLHPVTREETEYVVLNHVTRCGQPCKKKKKDRVAGRGFSRDGKMKGESRLNEHRVWKIRRMTRQLFHEA